MNDLTYISILADEKRKVKNIFSGKNSLKLKVFWKMNKNLKIFKKSCWLFFVNVLSYVSNRKKQVLKEGEKWTKEWK